MDRIAADLIVDRVVDRARLRHAVAVIGTGQLRVRPVRWARATAARTPVRAATATMGADHPPPPVRSWICGSRLCVRLRAAPADTRDPRAPHMAVPVARLRATVDLRATAAPEERQAMAEAADTIQRRAAEADAPTAAEVVDTRVVVVVAAPVAEDIAEVIAKNLGDATSLREAAT